MRQNVVICLLLLTLVREFAHAEAGLPYMGDRPVPCQIVEPDQRFEDLDAGYLTDEHCTTIYVMPPMLGTLKISRPAYLETRFCKAVDEAVISIENARAKVSDDIEEKAKFEAKAAQLMKAVYSIGKNEAFSVFSYTASLNWQTLLKAYHHANPSKDVKQMPIVTGLMNANILDPDAQEESVRTPLLYNKVYAPTFKSTPSELTSVPEAADVLSKITAGLDLKDTFIFGSAVGGQMALRLSGTCGLFDSDNKIKADPKSWFAGTYTYFYPVQTSSSFSIKLQNKPAFELELLKVITRQNGSITSAQINDIVKQVPIVSVQKKDGVGNSTDSDALEKEYKERMLQIVANSVVATIADRISTAVDSSKYTQSESRIERRCKGPKIFRRCWDHEYFVSVQKIDWGRVENNLKNLLNDESSSVRKYRTMYLYSTTAFANVQ